MVRKEKTYYQEIQDSKKLLKYAQALHQTYYQRKRALAITKLFPKMKDEKVLDVGCGGGFYSLIAAKKGAQDIIGVDMEKICVKATRLNLYKNMTLSNDGIVADCTNLPFANGTFNLILCIDVVEHIKHDKKLIRELFRILKSEGFLVISSQNSFSINFLLEGFYQRIIRRKKWMGWDPTHIRFYNPKSFFNLFKNFRVLKIVGTYYVPYNIIGLKFLREIIVTVNEFFESKCDQSPWNFCGWGIACLLKK